MGPEKEKMEVMVTGADIIGLALMAKKQAEEAEVGEEKGEVTWPSEIAKAVAPQQFEIDHAFLFAKEDKFVADMVKFLVRIHQTAIPKIIVDDNGNVEYVYSKDVTEQIKTIKKHIKIWRA